MMYRQVQIGTQLELHVVVSCTCRYCLVLLVDFQNCCAQDRGVWRSSANTVMKLEFYERMGTVLTD
jgi:hypothetical protein